MGHALQLYFSYIDANLYPLSFTRRSMATAIFFFPELLGSLILGSWSDRYGRKLFIVIGTLCGAVAVQLTAMTSHFGVLAFTRLLAGLSTASVIPATLGYLSAITAQSKSLRGKVMGLFEIATIGGTLAGVFVAGRFWDAFEVGAFSIDSAIYLVSLAVFWFGIMEARLVSPRRARWRIADTMRAAGDLLRQTWESIRGALWSARILRFVPAWLAINMILGAWLNNAIGQLVETSDRFPDQLLYGIFAESLRAGTDASTYASVVLAIFGLGGVLWSFSLGRFRRTGVMLVGSLGLFALCGFLFALNHAASVHDPLTTLYIVGALLSLLILSGFTPAALTYMADITEDAPTGRGAIMGLYSVFFGVGQLFGTLIGGMFVDWRGMDGLILFTLLLSVAAALTLIRLHRRI